MRKSLSTLNKSDAGTFISRGKKSGYKVGVQSRITSLWAILAFWAFGPYLAKIKIKIQISTSPVTFVKTRPKNWNLQTKFQDFSIGGSLKTVHRNNIQQRYFYVQKLQANRDLKKNHTSS